jgi:hypothetical protein
MGSRIGISSRSSGHSELECTRMELDVHDTAHPTAGWGQNCHVPEDQVDDHSQKCGKTSSGVNLHNGRISLHQRARSRKPTKGNSEYGPISSTGRGDVLG